MRERIESNMINSGILEPFCFCLFVEIQGFQKHHQAIQKFI